ncbi:MULTISPECIES: NlpC/P60 family protein [Acidaminococcus]|jgi:cell wall-associated NlpC family hydrolase|uniref:NlpC/P60 family protein n=1 Tax=Acidaminococcus TaxID=904 RepID=UPI00034E8322|nr:MULTISPECIES: NlpC/P60 family protein [Acidaminococcus]EPD71887.1 hypothetical protein HMPREF1479_01413 [Acidaminococcus sp. HPA0509]DAH12528.1 MAG TPA: NlpC/P60 family [Caudoviricetes sp.]
MSNLGNKIAAASLKWLGTPHVNMAKSRGHGVDCGMLLIASLEDAGAIAPNGIPVKPYSNMWHLSHGKEWFKSYVETYCDKVETMERGDFLLYQFGRCISHGAVYVGNGTICHAYVDTGVILSSINDSMLLDAKGESRLRGIYRFSPNKYKEVR